MRYIELLEWLQKRETKAKLRQENEKLRKELDVLTQSRKGEKANMNQAEIDHIEPKSKGGSNSYSNAQVLSKEENLRKGNKIE